MRSLLVKAASRGRRIVEVTPASAGWRYVGFEALRLAPGEEQAIDTGARELCLVVLTGQVDVQVGAERYTALGTRDSVFEPVSPAALWARRDALARWPMRLVWGMRDPAFGPAYLARWRAAFPGADVVELPDAGHFPWHEAPGAVAAALDRLLSPGLSRRDR